MIKRFDIFLAKDVDLGGVWDVWLNNFDDRNEGGVSYWKGFKVGALYCVTVETKESGGAVFRVDIYNVKAKKTESFIL